MKRLSLVGLFAGLAMILSASEVRPTPALVTSPSASELAVLAQAEPQAQPQQREAMQTFEGKIVKKDRQFVFQDSTGRDYMVDDQEKVKDWEGKNVKLTGKLAVATNTIQVSRIEAAQP